MADYFNFVEQNQMNEEISNTFSVKFKKCDEEFEKTIPRQNYKCQLNIKPSRNKNTKDQIHIYIKIIDNEITVPNEQVVVRLKINNNITNEQKRCIKPSPFKTQCILSMAENISIDFEDYIECILNFNVI